MEIYGESIPLQAAKTCEALNIQSRVKAALDKSAFRDGVCVISSPDSDCALILAQDGANLVLELHRRLEPLGTQRGGNIGPADPASAERLEASRLGQQLIIPFSEGRLDLGPGEAVFFVELNGIRPRRAVVKILGE